METVFCWYHGVVKTSLFSHGKKNMKHQELILFRSWEINQPFLKQLIASLLKVLSTNFISERLFFSVRCRYCWWRNWKKMALDFRLRSWIGITVQPNKACTIHPHVFITPLAASMPVAAALTISRDNPAPSPAAKRCFTVVCIFLFTFIRIA